jgi:hypothetical protein
VGGEARAHAAWASSREPELSERKAELANGLVLEMLRSLNAGQIPFIEGEAS